MRDKKKDRARDEDVEEDIRPKQSSTDLPFMTIEEASVLFLCLFVCLFVCCVSFLFFRLNYREWT